MNHIPSKDQGDAQTGLCDCNFLDFIDSLGKNPFLAIIACRGTVGQQTGTDLALADHVMLIRTEVEPLVQLPGFFVKGHAAQQIFNALGNGKCRIFIGWDGHGSNSL